MSETSESSEPISVPSDDDEHRSPAAGAVSVASVQVEEMDAEHEKCAAALDALIAKPTEPALRLVLREFTSHFAHEESLLDTHLYADILDGGGSSGGFSADASARRSHHGDHARMLSDIKRLLSAAATSSSGGGTGKKSGGVWVRQPAGELMLRRECVEEIVSDFEAHADLYDGAYAERLSAALAAAEAKQQPPPAVRAEGIEDGNSS